MNQRLSFNTTPIFQTPFPNQTTSSLFNPNSENVTRNDVHRPSRFVFSCIPKIPIENRTLTSNKTPTPVFFGSTASDLGTIGIDGGKMIETPLLQNFADENDNSSKLESNNIHKKDDNKLEFLNQECFNVDLDATVSKYFSSELNDLKIDYKENCSSKLNPKSGIPLFKTSSSQQTPTVRSRHPDFENVTSSAQLFRGAVNTFSDSEIFSAGNSNEVSYILCHLLFAIKASTLHCFLIMRQLRSSKRW